MLAAVRYACNCMIGRQHSYAAISWSYVLFLLVCAFEDIDSYNTYSELLCVRITSQIMSFALFTASAASCCSQVTCVQSIYRYLSKSSSKEVKKVHGGKGSCISVHKHGIERLCMSRQYTRKLTRQNHQTALAISNEHAQPKIHGFTAMQRL